MKGFFGNSLRVGVMDGHSVADEFTIRPKEHSIHLGENGKPLVITAEEQFSPRWMERISKSNGQAVEDEPEPVKLPADMTVKELKVALIEADIDVPNGTVKEDLIKLLTDWQLDNPA